MENQKNESADEPRTGLSLPAMLLILALAIVLAVGLAYLVVNPFFHQHPM